MNYEQLIKICKSCKEEKTLNDFHKHKSMPDGLCSICKDCNKERVKTWVKLNPEKRRAYGREYARKNPQYSLLWKKKNPERNKELKKNWGKKNSERIKIGKYGIDVETYYHLLNKQNGVCAICSGKDEKRNLSIDHDHSCCGGREACGKCIRGLLCSRCNTMIGMAKDNPDILSSAIKYLRN